ncbi:MerR family transcriptional regulator [Deinococcus roseus]|uniref:HTH merR-type domain-containing protein n=1 Tax=Deinococcus roseus TaxID=392414 RepID=A0ABQ2CVK7_9DEIO|nr:MerR family transcriptional regulator [Deinococcus roseus]GGJ18468.1 hypothetical protein GCM10008938_00760 [Deinococcus roseus]
MVNLQAYHSDSWNLDAFAERVNRLLPEFLPADKMNSRMQDTVNPRLIRHYTTLGLLDSPDREGREARYTYRHLLQLLLLRKMLAAGFATGIIAPITQEKTLEELEDLLLGERVAEKHPMDFFRKRAVQAEESRMEKEEAAPPLAASVPPSMPAPMAAPAPAAPAFPDFLQYGDARERKKARKAETYTRVPISEGVELHLTEDFEPIKNPTLLQKILKKIQQALED